MVKLARPYGALIKQVIDSAGNTNMNVDGSVTPVKYGFTCPPDVQAVLSRVNICMIDASLNATDFGGITGSITNGVKFIIFDKNDVVLLDLADRLRVDNNSDWGLLAGTDWIFQTAGPGDDSVTIRWSFSRSGRELLLKPGERFEVLIQDDLTSMTFFGMMLQGYFLDRNGNDLKLEE